MRTRLVRDHARRSGKGSRARARDAGCSFRRQAFRHIAGHRLRVGRRRRHAAGRLPGGPRGRGRRRLRAPIGRGRCLGKRAGCGRCARRRIRVAGCPDGWRRGRGWSGRRQHCLRRARGAWLVGQWRRLRGRRAPDLEAGLRRRPLAGGRSRFDRHAGCREPLRRQRGGGDGRGFSGHGGGGGRLKASGSRRRAPRHDGWRRGRGALDRRRDTRDGRTGPAPLDAGIGGRVGRRGGRACDGGRWRRQQACEQNREAARRLARVVTRGGGLGPGRGWGGWRLNWRGEHGEQLWSKPHAKRESGLQPGIFVTWRARSGPRSRQILPRAHRHCRVEAGAGSRAEVASGRQSEAWKAPGLPQRHPKRPNPIAKGLTSNTVAQSSR